VLRILIISNNCLSKTNSNGRTLLNLLGNFTADEVYQFYVANEVPQEEFCKEFLQITDRDIIKSYFCFSKKYSLFQNIQQNNSSELGKKIGGYGKKTVNKSLIRDILWNTSGWVKKKLIRFANDKNIDLILLQAGDNIFLHRLARKVAEKCSIPLLIYNTEDYYFKNYDYMQKKLHPSLMYKWYHRFFCREFKKVIALSSDEVYNCEGLQQLYNKTFNKSGKAIYAATNFISVEKVCENGLISYSGNLGCGRHLILMDVANSLQKISSDLYLDVYGPGNPEIIADFKSCQGIHFHGFVSYDKVCQIIKDSRLLVHVESFDVYYQQDTRFALSTKLADYASSNVPIFICAPTSSETYNYMQNHNAAFVVSKKEEIQDVLKNALFDTEDRDLKRANALILSRKNNNYEENGKKFRNIVEGIINAESK